MPKPVEGTISTDLLTVAVLAAAATLENCERPYEAWGISRDFELFIDSNDQWLVLIHMSRIAAYPCPVDHR